MSSSVPTSPGHSSWDIKSSSPISLPEVRKALQDMDTQGTTEEEDDYEPMNPAAADAWNNTRPALASHIYNVPRPHSKSESKISPVHYSSVVVSPESSMKVLRPNTGDSVNSKRNPTLTRPITYTKPGMYNNYYSEFRMNSSVNVMV